MTVVRLMLGLTALAGLLSACKFVPPPPEAVLAVSKASLSITADAPVRTLTIRNEGDEASELLWSVVTSSPALVVSPASGKLNADSQRRIDIKVDRSIVPIADRIEETITIQSNGGEATIYVTFSVVGTGLAACGTYPSGAVSQTSDWQPSDLRPSDSQHSEVVANDELLVQFNLTEAALAPAVLKGYQPNRAVLMLQLDSLSQSIALDYGFKLLKQATPERPALVRVPADIDPLAFAARLEADPRVLYAEPNYALELLATIPNDPRYGDQWTLSEFGLPQAWDLETGERSVTIAIIDSGVDMDHEDLEAKMLPGCDFFTQEAKEGQPALFGDNDPNPGLPNGGRSEHGTHVAGIAAAVGDNATGITGVGYGPGIKILPVKIFNNAGGGAKISHLIDALYWSAGIELPGVAPNPFPADIVNMSLGADPNEIPAELESIRTAAARVKERGVLMIAATANNGRSDLIYTPASDENVVAVGSVDSSRERSVFSNYSVSGPTADLMAPGGFGSGGCPAANVLSTYPNDMYGCLNGTSMASPFVAGVAALVWSQNPSLSAEQVRQRLYDTTFYDAGFMNPAEYGRGIVCADKALGAATLCGQ